MNASLRVVIRQPLAELWREDGFATRQRGRWLCASDMAALLRQSRVHFVVASSGEPLRWIALAECFAFWKREAKAHLACPNESVELSSYPDEYCYFASAWGGETLPIILLERQH